MADGTPAVTKCRARAFGTHLVTALGRGPSGTRAPRAKWHAPGETATPTASRKKRCSILDALGFKGIWQKYQPTEIAQALRVRREVVELVDEQVHPAGTAFRFFALSDTLVIAAVGNTPVTAALDDDARKAAQHAVLMVCLFVAGTISVAVAREPKLLFRGCVAAGGLYCDKECIIGGAVDEAATMMNDADAAVVCRIGRTT